MLRRKKAQAQDSMHQLTNGARAHAHELRSAAGERMDAAHDLARDWSDEAESRIRDRPWLALLVVGLAGVLLGKLLR